MHHRDFDTQLRLSKAERDFLMGVLMAITIIIAIHAARQFHGSRQGVFVSVVDQS